MKSAKWIKENKDEGFIEVHNILIKIYNRHIEDRFLSSASYDTLIILNDYFSKYERKVVK